MLNVLISERISDQMPEGGMRIRKRRSAKGHPRWPTLARPYQQYPKGRAAILKAIASSSQVTEAGPEQVQRH
ncbi:hypothetical protein [Massilia sp. WF1]|uniref:hypothetical protein n=1 Tax=Massilia sp. WF1 TaxID=1406431 RepID=UPI000AC7F0AF|nr:hypothetical protein [Massilia sp. WF1]